VRIRFDHGPEGSECAFERPVEVISAWEAEDVSAALEAMDSARDAGLWLAGFASYELGYALEPKLAPLMPGRRRVPLVQFGVYERPGAAAPLPEPAGRLDHFVPLWSEARYKQAFDAVHAHICAGDFYQANLTFACMMEAVGAKPAPVRLCVPVPASAVLVPSSKVEASAPPPAWVVSAQTAAPSVISRQT